MPREHRNIISYSTPEKIAERGQWLDRWAVVLKDELQKLVPNSGYEIVAVPKVTMEKLGIRTPGILGTEMDANGIHREVVVNTEYLGLPDRVIVEILTHQMIHHWQQAEGDKPSKITHHNKEFVDVGEELGIHVMQVNGRHYRQPSGRLVDLMYYQNLKTVETPALPEDVGNNDWWNYLPGQEDGINRRGESALVKWTCGCQEVRVGKGDFYAKCTICFNEFHRADLV